MKLNVSSKLLVQEQNCVQKALTTTNATNNESTRFNRSSNASGSKRQLSLAAEEKIQSSAILSQLLRGANHDRIVQKNDLGTSSQCVPTVSTRYATKNYLTRDVINFNTLNDRKGGEVIDMLSIPTSKYVGRQHISSQSPIYQPIKNRLSTAEDHIVTKLPELLSSPKTEAMPKINHKNKTPHGAYNDGFNVKDLLTDASKRTSIDLGGGFSSRARQQISIATSLNGDIRNQFLHNRKQTYTSNIMQPPHLTVSVNASRELEKDKLLRMAQKANHLTEALVKSNTSVN